MTQLAFDVDSLSIDPSTGTISLKVSPDALNAIQAKLKQPTPIDPPIPGLSTVLATIELKPDYIGVPYEPNPEHPGKPMPDPRPTPTPTPDRPTFPLPFSHGVIIRI